MFIFFPAYHTIQSLYHTTHTPTLLSGTLYDDEMDVGQRKFILFKGGSVFDFCLFLVHAVRDHATNGF